MTRMAMAWASCVLAVLGASRSWAQEELKPTDLTPGAPAPGTVVVNSWGMKLAYVPAGEFLMGSTDDEADRVDDERDRNGDEQPHRVRITRGFFLGVYEVTQEEYQRVMGRNPSAIQPGGSMSQWANGRDTTRFPVEMATWDEAAEFCRRLSDSPAERAKGFWYRLPTEAEWEYACRAGSTSAFDWGAALNGDRANCNGRTPYGTSSAGAFLGRTTEVGSYGPNAWGLHDMHGNVREWCSDWYSSDYYESSPAFDPRGPSRSSVKVIRGGSWICPPKDCRASNRYMQSPMVRHPNLGFRIAAVRSPEKSAALGASLSWAQNAPAARPTNGKPTPGAILVNSMGMKLAYIPAGEFLMGSSDEREGRLFEERRHQVRITQGFYLGQFEVTQEEYVQVMGKNPSRFHSGGASQGVVRGQDTSRFPVENVSWEEAAEFCRRLSALPAERAKGFRYRLPTEAEWEYACRAGTATPFHFGGMLNGDRANCNGEEPYGTSAEGEFLGRPARVGAYGPNAWGLHDMHGNVSEWCLDWYDGDYYQSAPAADPGGPTEGSFRVLRGGSWGSSPKHCQSSTRGASAPTFQSHDLGFRVAVVPSDE